MPPLHILVEVFLYAVAPTALVAALCLTVAVRVGGVKAAPLGAALGLAAGLVVGAWLRDTLTLIAAVPGWAHLTPQAVTAYLEDAPAILRNALTLMPGESAWNRLPLAAGGALIVGLVGRLLKLPAAAAWLLPAVAVGGLTWWVIPEATRVLAWWIAPAFALVVLGQWLVLEKLAAQPPGGSILFVMAASALVAAGVLIHAGSARLTDGATLLAAALAGVAIVASLRPSDAGAVMPGVAVLLPGFLLLGQQETFSEIPWHAFALAAGAPLALAFTWPLRGWTGPRLVILRVAVMLPPWIAALYLATKAGSLEFE